RRQSERANSRARDTIRTPCSWRYRLLPGGERERLSESRARFVRGMLRTLLSRQTPHPGCWPVRELVAFFHRSKAEMQSGRRQAPRLAPHTTKKFRAYRGPIELV